MVHIYIAKDELWNDGREKRIPILWVAVASWQFFASLSSFLRLCHDDNDKKERKREGERLRLRLRLSLFRVCNGPSRARLGQGKVAGTIR